jgi:hypothetical protein
MSMVVLHPSQASVTISGNDYPYERRWSGRRLLPVDGYLAFDTETEVVDLRCQIPRLALASASAGDGDSCLIHPDDIGTFVLAHKGLHWVTHNSCFDFWTVEAHLRQRGEEQARQAWWEIADRNRLHDSMLMDMLVRLARNDSYPDPRNLGVVARAYAKLEVSKDDPYRKRYGEIIGKSWNDVEDGFFDYAVKDAIVTRPAYLALRKQALALIEEFGRHNADVLPGARQKFGLLSEAIQVKKGIALAQIMRSGMAVDLEWVRRTEHELRQELLRAAKAAQAICPVYKVDEAGHIVSSGKTRTPALLDQVMRARLAQIKEAIEAETGSPLPIPTKKTGLSRSVKVWADYAHLHPFLQHWIKAQNLTKLLQFFTLFEQQVDVGELAQVLEVDQDSLAVALKAKAGEDEALAVNLEDLPRIATPKNRKLGKLGLEPERVLTAARQIAAAHRQPFCTVHPSYSVMVRTGRTSCSGP